MKILFDYGVGGEPEGSPPTFKQCAEADIHAAFLNPDEHGEIRTIRYDGVACTERLSYILANKTYVPSKFETFYVYEPKKRLVQAPAFVDKVVQHALVDNILYDTITHSRSCTWTSSTTG